MCGLIEYTAGELLGQKMDAFFRNESGKISLAENKMGQALCGIQESVLITKNGKKIYVSISINPVFDEEKRYRGALAMLTDITERKRSEQEMIWLIDNTEECFILLNLDLKIVSFNRQFRYMYSLYFGKTVIKGDSILDYALPEKRDGISEIYRRVLEGAEKQTEISIKPAVLPEKIFAVKYKPAKDEKGGIIGVFVSICDVTGRRKSEQQLILNEKRYRALIENGVDAIVILDRDGKTLYVSAAFKKILGYVDNEVRKLDLFSLIHPGDRHTMPPIWKKIHESGSVPVPGLPARILHKDGTWRWIEGVVTNMLQNPAVNGIVINFKDATEKIKAEEQKEFEKRDKEALINTTEDLMWSVSNDYKLIAANHAFINVLKVFTGIELKTGDDLMLTKNFPDEFLSVWGMLYSRALKGESFVEEIYTPASKNYPETWAETRFNPIYDGSHISGVACYTRDTTVARTFKDKLIGINKKFASAQQTAQLGYWQSDINSHNLSWSDEVYRIWGVTVDTFEVNYDNFYNSIHPDDRDIFTGSRKLAFEGAVKFDVEHRIILPDHSIKYVHEKGELIYDAKNQPAHFEGTVQDITARKLAEIKIVESEIRYRSLIDQATDAICIAGPSLKFTDMNPYACRILGYSMQEALQMSLADILFIEDLKVNPLKMDEIKSGKTVKNERRLKRKDGTAIVMEVSSKMMDDGRFMIFGHDISERILAEINIKESNKRFEFVTEATSDAIWDWDMKNQTIYWGESFHTIFGYNPQKIKKDISSRTDHIHPDDAGRVNQGILEFINGEGTKWEDQYRYQKKDQTYAYVVDKGFAIRNEEGKAIRMVGAMQDITKRKKDEFALQQSESRLLGIIASQTNYIIRTDLTGNYTYYNPKFMDDFGWIYNQNSLLGFNSMNSVMEYHHQVVKDTFEKCLAKPNGICQIEVDKPGKNGTVKTTLWDFICLTDVRGDPVEMQCVGIDISQRKKAESAFIETLKEKNTILESIGDAFFAVDKAWIVTYWNSKAEKMLNTPRKEIVGYALWDVFSESIGSFSYIKYHEAVQIKKVVEFEDYYPPVNKWYQVSAYPSDNGLSVYFKDITERKLSEISLKALNENIHQNAKKLVESNAELGQFAYVASHDLQEPLRMVTSYLTQLEKKYGDIIDERGKKYIFFAVDGAKRMRQIILDLLEYSRVGRTEDNIVSIDLNELIGEIQILYSKQVLENKAVIIVDKLPVLHTYRSPVRQVFQNLISNALKYTRKGVSPEIRIHVTESPELWQFEVSDNGIGIEEEYFDKIFVIFQRLHNKDEFSGTGLGLAISKKIIENMGGSIWVESTEGAGSSFYFTIKK